MVKETTVLRQFQSFSKVQARENKLEGFIVMNSQEDHSDPNSHYFLEF